VQALAPNWFFKNRAEAGVRRAGETLLAFLNIAS
jgi:hypothetical protein